MDFGSLKKIKPNQKHHQSQWSEIVTSLTFNVQICSELINLSLLNFDPGCCRQLRTFISHAFLLVPSWTITSIIRFL